jgi:tetratricopeptide (TPR) repeat protein
MHRKERCGWLPKWSLSSLFLLLVVGVSVSKAQPGRGAALVLKGIAQYEDSALFRAAIVTLEEAFKYDLDSRDSTRAYFYLGFSHFKLGQQEDGNRFFRTVVQRDANARLPQGAEEFADRLGRVKQQLKEEPDAPVAEPIPSDSLRAVKPQARSESVYVKYPVYVGPQFGNYLAGASGGAVLGLASYFTSVLFDNMAVEKVRAFTLTGDSAYAQELKDKAQQYHSLGDVFYYSSYPLIAVGFYLGLKVSERAFPGKVSFLEEDSPTRICCSLGKNFNLSLGIRRSIW